MSFSNFFQKRRRQDSLDNFKVVLNTKMKLSEEQRNTITTIVKDGIANGLDNGDIAIQIMAYTGFYSGATIYRRRNSFEVIF